MPPRFTPFFQSLANRGMKQTNNAINRMGNPSPMGGPGEKKEEYKTKGQYGPGGFAPIYWQGGPNLGPPPWQGTPVEVTPAPIGSLDDLMKRSGDHMPAPSGVGNYLKPPGLEEYEKGPNLVPIMQSLLDSSKFEEEYLAPPGIQQAGGRPIKKYQRGGFVSPYGGGNINNPLMQKPNAIGLPPYSPDFGPGTNIIGQGSQIGSSMDGEIIDPWQPGYEPDPPYTGPTKGPIYQETGPSTGFGDSEMGVINPVGPDYDPGGVIDTNFLQEDPNFNYGPGGGVTTPDINESPLLTQGSMGAGFDVNNDGVVDVLDAGMVSGMTEEDFASMMGFGAPNQPYSDFSEYFQDLTQQYGQQWADTLSQEDLQQLEYDFMGGNLMNQPNYSSQYSQQGFLENLHQYINPMQSSAQQFTGGGGQAGGAAKKLYYPGTSGGFASVGSGIGGSTLEELLKKYR